MLGNNPSPVNTGNHSPDSDGNNSNPIKVGKRDELSMRIKLEVGMLPEKIITAFQLVHEEVVNEETALNFCRDAASHLHDIEMDLIIVSSQGSLQESDVVDYLQKQENMLQQCVRKLENSASIRVALVSKLREALLDQESKLDLIRNELHVAQRQMEKAGDIKLMLTSSFSAPTAHLLKDEPGHGVNILNSPPPFNPLSSFVKSISQEESTKAAAAALAAQLTALSSSAQMLTSVLSSLVAEEAASKSSGLKRPKFETPMSFSGASNPELAKSGYFPTVLLTTNVQPGQAIGAHSASQLNPLQPPFCPPPPPQLAPPDSSGNQVVQSSMMGLSFNYGTGNPLTPPFSSNTSMGHARPGPSLQQPMTENHQNQQPQQVPSNGGKLRSLGTGFNGQSHHPSIPPPIHK